MTTDTGNVGNLLKDIFLLSLNQVTFVNPMVSRKPKLQRQRKIFKINRGMFCCIYTRCSGLVFANFRSPKGRIALQVARKIASYDRAKTHVIFLCLFFQGKISCGQDK